MTKQILTIALSHLRAGDNFTALAVSANLLDAPECRRARLNWLHSLAAFDEATSKAKTAN